MKKIFCVFLTASLVSGCFDVYIYLIPQKDNSYIISQRVSVGMSFFSIINSLKDSLKTGEKKEPSDSLSFRKMADSILDEASKKDRGFDKLPGYISHSMRDSIADSTVFFFTDIHVKNANVLPAYMRAIQAPDKKSEPEDLVFQLSVSHPTGMTKFDIVAKKMKKDGGNDLKFWDLPEFKGKGYHVSVISENLLSPKINSLLKPAAGGQEWFVPFESLKDWPKGKTKKVQFLVRNRN